MTEYWKSNDRKFCDFCKCWISDNKVSVSFHENGKRHKLNVSKRIAEIRRFSEKADKESRQMDADIRKMEAAALASYANDVQAKGDMTAQSVSVMNNVGNSAGERPINSKTSAQVDPMRLVGDSDDEDDRRVRTDKVDHEQVPNASLWVESKCDKGYTYYWNVKTNESVWKEPKEGYLSWEDYQRINDIAIKQQEMQQAAEAKRFRENVNEEVARYNREKLKKYCKRDGTEETKTSQEIRATYKTQEEAAAVTIGAWQTVEEKPPPQAIDWELPKSDKLYIAPVVSEIVPEPPVKRFKEKTITSLDDESSDPKTTVFKKRKNFSKGNARKRLEDD
ncbi:WW domain-binding protein 4 [Teleopsis dalmanni]|uniref:WW domain-binding protein 4 n=1 Tax=Teleopsis dalmanni TaxID=139649 RepID=UPI0018CE5B50|nr:WW domain-binding protein 4 [Teleopsis dalmanni]